MAKLLMGTKAPGFGADAAADKRAERDLPPAARRALQEAEARRTQSKPAPPRELNGRSGLDPVRYGDYSSFSPLAGRRLGCGAGRVSERPTA